jgi:hypothetical protein
MDESIIALTIINPDRIRKSFWLKSKVIGYAEPEINDDDRINAYVYLDCCEGMIYVSETVKEIYELLRS